MLTHHSLYTHIRKKRYQTLKDLTESLKDLSRKLGIPLSQGKAYQTTRFHLLCLERQGKIKRILKSKALYVDIQQYQEVMNDFKLWILEKISQGHATPSQLKAVPLTPRGERLAIDLIMKILGELEAEGQIERQGATSKGRTKAYTIVAAPTISEPDTVSPTWNAERQAQTDLLNATAQLYRRQPFCSPIELARKAGLELGEAKHQLEYLFDRGLLKRKQIGAMLLYALADDFQEQFQQQHWNISCEETSSGTLKFEYQPAVAEEYKRYNIRKKPPILTTGRRQTLKCFSWHVSPTVTHTQDRTQKNNIIRLSTHPYAASGNAPPQ